MTLLLALAVASLFGCGAYLLLKHDLVRVAAQVNWAGRTSMEIGVRVTAERWDEVGPATHVASAYVVYVGVDEDERPRPVPPVLPETDEDRRRFHEAEIRRRSRLERREAIQRSRERQD